MQDFGQWLLQYLSVRLTHVNVVSIQTAYTMIDDV